MCLLTLGSNDLNTSKAQHYSLYAQNNNYEPFVVLPTAFLRQKPYIITVSNLVFYARSAIHNHTYVETLAVICK